MDSNRRTPIPSRLVSVLVAAVLTGPAAAALPLASAGVALVLAPAGSALAATEGVAAEPRTIRVSASASVKAAPDRAGVDVSVVARAATAKEASESNARTSKGVLEALRKAVGDDGEVSTGGYDISPEYDYDNVRPGVQGPRLVGYVATNRLQVVTGNLPGLGALLDAAVSAGANQVDSIRFFLDDEEAARRQALLEAGRKARAEAETIAQSLGVSLGDVLEASSQSDYWPPVAYGRKAMMMEAAAAPPTSVVPGSLDLSAGVTVVWSIR